MKKETSGFGGMVVIALCVVMALVGGLFGAVYADDSNQVTSLQSEKAILEDSVSDLEDDLAEFVSYGKELEAAILRKGELLSETQAALKAEQDKEPETVEVVKEVEVPVEVPMEVFVENPDMEEIEWYFDNLGGDTDSVEELLENIEYMRLAEDIMTEDIEDADDFDDLGYSNSEIKVSRVDDMTIEVIDRDDREFLVCAEVKVVYDDGDDKETEYMDACVDFFEDNDEDLDHDLYIDV